MLMQRSWPARWRHPLDKRILKAPAVLAMINKNNNCIFPQYLSYKIEALHQTQKQYQCTKERSIHWLKWCLFWMIKQNSHTVHIYEKDLTLKQWTSLGSVMYNNNKHNKFCSEFLFEGHWCGEPNYSWLQKIQLDFLLFFKAVSNLIQEASLVLTPVGWWKIWKYSLTLEPN